MDNSQYNLSNISGLGDKLRAFLGQPSTGRRNNDKPIKSFLDVVLGLYTHIWLTKYIVPYGVGVIIARFHWKLSIVYRADRGSNPRVGAFFLHFQFLYHHGLTS